MTGSCSFSPAGIGSSQLVKACKCSERASASTSYGSFPVRNKHLDFSASTSYSFWSWPVRNRCTKLSSKHLDLPASTSYSFWSWPVQTRHLVCAKLTNGHLSHQARNSGLEATRADAVRGRPKAVQDVSDTVDLDEVDWETLDLNEEGAEELLREGKIAQLSNMTPSEIYALPRSERVVPKRRKGAKNAFFQLGYGAKLERIRQSLSSNREEESGKEKKLEAMLRSMEFTEDLPFRSSRKFMVSSTFGTRKLEALKKSGLLPEVSPRQQVYENEMKERPKEQRTRKAVMAEHFARHQDSAVGMIHKVFREWQAGILKPDTRGPKKKIEVGDEYGVEYGLSYDISRMHIPFRFRAQDAFKELLDLSEEERPKYFHQDFLDCLEPEGVTVKFEQFKRVFYDTLIRRAKALQPYCASLTDNFGLDSSSIDMAVYLTRFLTRNYKDPEDVSAIIAAVEDRIRVLADRVMLTRDLAMELLISYPCYFSPLMDLERKVDEVLGMLRRLRFDSEDIIKLIYRNPAVFNTRLERLAQNIELLQAFGLAEPEYACRVPWLLGINLHYRLAERALLLRKYGIQDHEMPHIFQRNVQIFCSTVPTIKKRLMYLDNLGRGQEWLRELVIQRPKLLICHVERQVKRIKSSFQKVGLKLPEDELLDLVTRHTPLYQMSGRKLDEGLKYYTKELGLSPEIFLEFPQALGYSLEKRVRPRVNLVRTLGIVIADRGQPGLSLAQILTLTFPAFKFSIESGAWLRKYGGHVKQLEYDDTGAILANLAEEEAADLTDAEDVELDLDLADVDEEP